MATMGVQPNHEQHESRLEAFGLSTELIHDGLRRGAESAANRSSCALSTSAGTDIYHDGMEDFARLLAPDGWRMIDFDGQPRLVHPKGLLAFTISSGINVRSGELRRVPRTRRKGMATRLSLNPQPSHPSLFEDINAPDSADLDTRDASAPFYFLLCERVVHGGGLNVELARPASMTEGGRVNEWSDRIPVGFLALEGDLSVFDGPDEPSSFDVSVEPR